MLVFVRQGWIAPRWRSNQKADLVLDSVLGFHGFHHWNCCDAVLRGGLDDLSRYRHEPVDDSDYPVARHDYPVVFVP